MVDFVDSHRDNYGVEQICRVLPISPSSYHEHKARQREPALLPTRMRRDAELLVEIERVWRENFCVYGVRKLWRQLLREGVVVARCTVARLMKELGLRGVIRGSTCRTTVPSTAAACPDDHVNRCFTASRPNELWVADFTYGAPSLRRLQEGVAVA